MAERTPNPERRPRRVMLGIVVGVLLLAIFIGAAWYFTSDSFNLFVRGKIVAALDEATGGKATIGSLHWKLSKLEVEIRDVTIRGKEAANEKPFAQIDRLFVRAKIISLFSREFGLNYLEIDNPAIHLITYRDGTTNMPTPRTKQKQSTNPVDKLFSLAVDRAVISGGVLLWNNAAMPLDFSANDVAAELGFAAADQRYDGNIHLGKLDAKYNQFRPITANSEINYSIFPTKFHLKAFRLASGRTNVEASGELVDFNDPKVKLAYDAVVDLAQVGSVMRNPTLQGGLATLKGTGTWTQQDFASTARFQLSDGAVRAGKTRVAGIAAGSNLVLSKTKLQFNDLFAHALDGTLVGDAVIMNWASTPEAKNEPPQHGVAHLNLSGLQLATITREASTRAMPLNKAGLAGSVRGTLTAEWTGSATKAVAHVSAQVVPPAQVTPQQVPVTARMEATYNGARQLLEVAQFNAATRFARLNAAGVVGSSSANLRLGLTTTNLSEFQPAIAAFGGPAKMPVELAGAASFNGTVSGALAAPTITGHLEATNFTTVFAVAPPAPAATPLQTVAAKPPPSQQPQTPSERRIHWDRLAADVLYSRDRAGVSNGQLQHGKSQITFSADAALRQSKFTPQTPFTARASIRNADVADIQAMAGLNYPVTGTLNLDINASGTQANPQATGRIALTNAVAYNEPVRSLTANVRVANRAVDLSNIALVTDAGQITGTAGYSLASKAFQFNLQGNGLELAKLKDAQQAGVTGRATFTAQGSGTVEAPVLNATLRVQDVTLNGEQVGAISADAVTHGDSLRLTASTRYNDAQMQLTGDVHLRGDFPASLHFHFAKFDFDPLLKRYMQGRVTGHSAIAGDIRADGPLRQPLQMNVVGEIGQVSAELESIRLSNDGPIRFTMQNQVVKLERLHILGTETDLTASGTLSLAGARAMDITGNGRVNLQLLQSLNPAFNSSGLVTMQLQARGTMQRPDLTGQIEITNAALSYIDLPNGVADVNGTLVFNQDRLEVRKLSAKSGGGGIDIGGYIGLARGGADLNLTATARDIRLRYPPGVSAMANADLKLTGNLNNSLLSGDVTVTRFALNQQFDFSLYLARAKQPPTTPDPKSPLNNLRLDVHIVSTPELQFQTTMAKLSGDVDLHVRGTGTRPAVLGKVNILEGSLVFNGTKYVLERGDIIFTNPVRIEPILNITAAARVSEYDITISLHGPIEQLRTSYRSDPPVPEGDIIALLAFGHTRDQSNAVNSQATPNFTETASNAILGQALNSVVSSRVQRLFGISKIKVDPAGSAFISPVAPTTRPGPSVTIEQQVSDKLTLTYITDVTQSAQQIISAEYNVNRNISIVAVRDQYGVLGIDVKIRQRKR